MKKRLFGLVLVLSMVFSMTATVSADANANWNAGKGTATVDGVKDDAYAGAQEMVMAAVSDGETDGTTASAWALYDAEAIYFFIEVKDSVLDDTNANAWEKDSIELRFDMNSNIAQAYAVSETCDGAYAANVEAKVLKTDAGYNVEYKVPYAAVEGASAKFSLQVNAASDGKRNCTLHTNADLKDVWQDNSVMENLVFAAADTAATTAEATTDVAKTGVVAMGAVFGLGAVATAAGAILVKGKKEK